jgi:hypothetical protein
MQLFAILPRDRPNDAGQMQIIESRGITPVAALARGRAMCLTEVNAKNL